MMLQRQTQEKYMIYESSDQLQLETNDYLLEPLDLSLPKVTAKNEHFVRSGDKSQNEERLLNLTGSLNSEHNGETLECFPRKSFTISALLSDRASPLNDPNDQSMTTLIGKVSVDTTWRKHIGSHCFPCNQCSPVSFSSKMGLSHHVLKTHGFFSCHICNERFNRLNHLIGHALLHINFKCPLCQQICLNKGGLMSHIKYRHPGDNPKCMILYYFCSLKASAVVPCQSGCNNLNNQ